MDTLLGKKVRTGGGGDGARGDPFAPTRVVWEREDRFINEPLCPIGLVVA